ncbi:MAG: PAS domain S-box protein [bacterium]
MRKVIAESGKADKKYNQLEEAQLSSADKYLAVLQELPDIVYKLDPDGIFTFINNTVRVLGYEPNELTGKHFRKIIHPEDVKIFGRFYVLPKYKGKVTGGKNAPKLFDERRSGKRKTKELTIRLIPKDKKRSRVRIGSVIAFGDVSSTGYYDTDKKKKEKKFLGTLGIIRDITERIEIKKKIKESGKKFEVLFESANDIIIYVDKHGKILKVNKKAADIVGYKKDEIIGKNVFKLGLFRKKNLAIILTLFKNTVKRGKLRIVDGKEINISEFELKHKNGSRVFVEVNTQAVEKNGKLEGFLSIIRNITERKRTLEALAKSEVKHRTLVENMHDGLIQVDKQDKIIFVNDQICQMLGYTRNELIGKIGYKIFFSKKDREVIKYYNKRRLRKLSDHYEIKMKKKSGDYIWTQIRGSPIIDSGGVVQGSLGVISDISERKEAEAKLHYQADLLANVSDAVFSVDNDTIIRSWNKAAEKIYGWKAQEVIDKPMHKVTKVEYPGGETVKNIYKKLSKKGYWTGVVTERRKDGKTIIISRSMAQIIDASGNIIGAVTANRDITERRQAEEALKGSEKNFKELAEKSPLGVVIADDKGNHLYANKQFAEITGYSIDELIGMNGFEVLTTPEDKKKYMRIMKKRVKNSAHRKVYERILLRKDGIKIITRFFTTKIKWKDKMCPMAIVQNITKQTKTKEALRESEEKYSSVLENSKDAVIIHQNRIIKYANRATAQSTGYTIDELLGKNIIELTTPEYRELVAERYAARLAGKDIPNIYEIAVFKKDGSVLPIELSVSIMNYEGKPSGLVFMRDITDRKQAEKKLKASLKEKEVLLRELHHRVKNNMQIISSLINLQTRYLKDKKAVRMFKESQDRIRSMALVHEKLYQSENLTQIDIGGYISELTNQIRRSHIINPEMIKLNIKVKEMFLNINTAIPCGLVINELASNAFKYAFPSNRKGEIVIELFLDKDGLVTLIVKDDGIGFPEDIDVHNTETLGLQLVNALVEQLNGTIELDRSSGTAFKIRFSESTIEKER